MAENLIFIFGWVFGVSFWFGVNFGFSGFFFDFWFIGRGFRGRYCILFGFLGFDLVCIDGFMFGWLVILVVLFFCWYMVIWLGSFLVFLSIFRRIRLGFLLN